MTVDPVGPASIRNVALVGHGGSGKTTLAEALMHRAGAIDRMGRVEDGSTVCDTDPQERRHQQSVSLAIAPFVWKDHKINLIDTPGYGDFEGEVAAALRVVDLAIFVVSAVDGVEAQTVRMWKLAERLELPRMVFVNKLDRERSSFTRTLEQLRARFGAGVAPVELPIGDEDAFRGVADLLSDVAYIYDDDGRSSSTSIPDDMRELEHRIHDNLVEGIVVANDEQLERYLAGEVIPVEDLERTLALGIGRAEVFPVVCGSAVAEVGVDRLADLICEIGPSPLDRPPVTVSVGPEMVEVDPDPAGDVLAFVFKTYADPYGAISVFKVLTGTITVDDHLTNSRTGADERLHGLFTLRGRTHVPVGVVPAGDIAAVAKLSGTETGDTLTSRGRTVVVPRTEMPAATFAVAVTPRTQADDDKLTVSLHRLVDEDPSLVVDRSDETRQTVLRGLGETHIQIALERLEEHFGVRVIADDVRVPYRETVSSTAEAEGRHKKQSGGHGQFAVCVLRIEPLARGSGFEFVDQVVGGAIPRQYLPAVRKGVEEAMAEGGPNGYPVVDVRVTCLDGRHHPVDSSEMSFKLAARLAFSEAVARARPVVIEPISTLAVTVPIDLQGEVIGHLNAHRARVSGTSTGDRGEQVIEASIPTSELRRYAVDLRSLTRGLGTFQASHERYDVVPDHAGGT